MKLLVTGAAGFIGRNVLRGVPPDWDVVATDCRTKDLDGFVDAIGARSVHTIQADLTDPGSLARLRSSHGNSFDACVYLAANGDPAVSVERPAFDLTANTLSVVRVLEALRFDKLVFFSSGAVYDGLSGPVSPAAPVAPRLPYAISKLASEHYLHHFQRQGRIRSLYNVRFFGAYGPYEPARKIYGRLVRRFALERDPHYSVRGNGQNLIDAMYVDDTVRAILTLLNAPGEGATLDCASAAPLTITSLVQRAAATFGLQAEISYTGSVPEFIEFHTVDRTMRDRYGFVPEISLEDGLLRLAEFLKSA